MTDNPREHWNQRYRESDPNTEPVQILREYLGQLDGTRGLDVATGGGRNAVALASEGFDVDAIDISDEGLTVARQFADEQGVGSAIGWIRADVESYDFPSSEYDVVIVSHYHSMNTVAELVHTLAPGGTLLYEHSVQHPTDGDHRFRYYPNDLLRAVLSLRIVEYTEPYDIDGEEPSVRLVARRPSNDLV